MDSFMVMEPLQKRTEPKQLASGIRENGNNEDGSVIFY
jgi:hypothetical protein